MGRVDDNLLVELEKKYCPPVDSALFAAIASDYDLSTPEGVKHLKESLDAIKGLAIEQEDLPFDPSGTATGHNDSTDLRGVSSDPDISNPGLENYQTPTDLTSLTTALLSSNGDDKANSTMSSTLATYIVAADGSLEFSGATQEDKVRSLAEMFPSISRLNIEQALKKSANDISKSMDVLLNLVFFDETQTAQDDNRIVIPKGIDGFINGACEASLPKGRNKKRHKHQKVPLNINSPSVEAAVGNRWEAGKTDIEFIASRAPNLPLEKVKSAFFAHSMSLPATIRALALAAAPKEGKEIESDTVMVAQVTELANDYPSISTTTLAGLLRVTSNMISATSELAAVMMRQSQVSVDELIKFTPAPLNLHDDDADTSDQRSGDNQTLHGDLDYKQARAASDAHFEAGAAAYRQASEAARRARSNHLYGAAAAVYRDRGQEHHAYARRQLAIASDRLVAQQSADGEVDLHGVTVDYGLRIARARVEAWWDSLGDAKHIRGGGKHVHGGFKIITGVGNHSPDGTSRLGPAVSKMLIREGWHIEIHHGFIVVVKKSSRRTP